MTDAARAEALGIVIRDISRAVGRDFANGFAVGVMACGVIARRDAVTAAGLGEVLVRYGNERVNRELFEDFATSLIAVWDITG